LQKAIRMPAPVLLVLYGRRRCGKSRLLQEIIRKRDIYFVADQREKPLQIESLAREISRFLPGFDQVTYPSWEVLLDALKAREPEERCLVLDEFPYLVSQAPELPSILQKVMDNPAGKINIVLCGSSQKMMHGIVLDSTAPLYGRAREILKIRPLEMEWLPTALGQRGTKAVESYAVWGGVPRYWELAHRFNNLDDAIKELIFDRDGILHNEPQRLLLDDLRSPVQAQSLLSLIANGCHRLSEIAARIGKPAGSLSRPLSNLIDLGYVKRELPFQESTKSTKRSLYKLEDPFLLFWYRYVQKYQSLLEQDLIDAVFDDFKADFSLHVAVIWEELARKSVHRLNIGHLQWKPAARWWGRGRDGGPMEIDVVSESFDRQHILFGEAKWRQVRNTGAVFKKLQHAAQNYPHMRGQKPIFACWFKQAGKSASAEVTVLRPRDLLSR